MSGISTSDEHSALPAVLLVWIHGFKGNDNTFEGFPDRITYTLSHTFASRLNITSRVYPAYKTAGSLEEAVTKFCEWLTTLVVDTEQSGTEARSKNAKGKGKAVPEERIPARVVLLGHSMGGLVAADTILSLTQSTESGSTAIWPKIIGLLAFDTPYLGLNPGTFSNTADQYIQQATKVHDVVSAVTGYSLGSLLGAKAGAEASKTKAASDKMQKEPSASGSSMAKSGSGGAGGGWLSLRTLGATLGGTALAAAAAGLAYTQRDAISSLGVNSWSFVTEHLEFVGALWKTEELKTRLQNIVDLETTRKGTDSIGFHCFHTVIPGKAQDERTFIILPAAKKEPKLSKRFSPNKNEKAANEVDAHVTMFNAENTGNYDLALQTVRVLTEWIERTS